MRKIVILIIILLMVTGCTKEPETIRIGVNDWPPCEVWYVAQEQNFFEGVNVELVRFSTWTDNMNSLYLGKIDITHSTYFNNILFSEKGEWGQMFAPIDTIAGSDGMVVRDTIADMADLKGKKIAVEVGTDEHYLLFKALEHFGIAIEEVTIVSASSAKTAELFISNEVDAVFTYEPFLSKAAEEGGGSIVFTTSDIPGYMVDVLVGNKDKLEKIPEAYVRVMEGYYKARAYIETNEAYDLMAANESMDVEAFKGFYNSFELFDAQEALAIMNSDDYHRIHNEMMAFIYENGLLTKVKDKEELLNKEILTGVIENEE